MTEDEELELIEEKQKCFDDECSEYNPERGLEISKQLEEYYNSEK